MPFCSSTNHIYFTKATVELGINYENDLKGYVLLGLVQCLPDNENE